MGESILVVHASVGGGHKAAARAVARAIGQLAPDRQVEVLDALDGMSASFRAAYNGSFEVGVGHTPGLYGAFFDATRELDRSPAFRAARRLVNAAHAEVLTRQLREAQPAAIVATHFLPLEVALRERAAGRISCPIFGVVTDYVGHGLWRQKDADLTFCAPGRAAVDLRRGGVPAGRIVTSGIPIDPRLALPYDRAASKRAAKLSLERPTVAVLAGGAGMGPLVEVMTSTARALRGAADLVVVAGSNEALKEQAASAARDLPGSIRVEGFVDPIAELLRGADVIVTKPGGLTTSECLALGKATVLYEAAPGQERENARRCEALRAARFCPAPADAAAAVVELVRDPAAREALEARALRAGRPEAALEVAARVLRRVDCHERAARAAVERTTSGLSALEAALGVAA